ncbi:hypothetical protein B0H15DRAFT_843669 [Mycena belliarum]|uniref:Short-chain dehydrogenase/reductase SDR n=1 Tax=Mycena belliarum TaxID=1033014 RepID=A0AAD6U1Y2_9AGAR|nr:hypothetical protein B0H15DRAFT_843669 [Mycena belliae]
MYPDSRMPKTAIITGSSSGIGRESAIALSKAGWNVVLTGRREEALQETASFCQSPESCLVLAGDVTDEEFVKKLFAATVSRFQRLDLLFNNAGVNSPAVPFEDLTLATFQNVISVNLTGPFLCAREAVRIYKNQTPPGGRIINNGSLSAHTPRPLSGPYTASKHGLTGLSKSLSLDGRAFDITCTQIDIGNAATVLTERMTGGVLQPDGRRAPEARFDVAHVADAVVHIASLPPDVSVPHYTIMCVPQICPRCGVDFVLTRAARAPFAGRG